MGHAWRDKYICFVWLSNGVLSVFSPICPTLPRPSVLLIPTLMDWDRRGGLGQIGKIELKPTKVKWSECPKSNNHHKVVYLGKAVASKPKKKKNRGWSHFVALENLFPMVICFLIFKFFP